MSTTTTFEPEFRPEFRPELSPDPSVTAVPFSRLLRAELRKLVDTRAGFWLLIAIGLITVAVIVVFLFVADPDQLTFINFVGATATPQSILLPVLGILAVTAEWSQRTGLVTFTLEPSRIRIAVAKLVAVVLVGMLAVVAALGAAALSNLAGMAFMDGASSWNFGAANVRDFFAIQLIGILQGFAFGMLLMNTAAAIVLYYVIPIAWSVLFAMVGALENAAPWLDLNTAMAPAFEQQTFASGDWAHIAVAGTIWVLLPLALGTLRLLHREVKSA
ncbi:ABC transporter permease [Kribbella shirazensis]|uniref:ABC-type transport system involved in multi-copper enzyme maturation permease subunit n=1 Tax=Kribbella shirazensis TaxID=1105143 RepID=A0A7X5VHN6_9ACTN|nr:ABC transporter permease [Kribbella shirazensis]NIK61485.1 ABC-type transport system involved in multi-copper enzyme maturation permease subunit [Kribbella shirazensis]